MTGTDVVSASDADDEVRAIVRGVVDAMRAGVPLERMAVLYGTKEPYARLLHEHLTAAGIAHNGASVRTLADSVLGRSLLGLLRARRSRLPARRRDRVVRRRAPSRRSRPARAGHGMGARVPQGRCRRRARRMANAPRRVRGAPGRRRKRRSTSSRRRQRSARSSSTPRVGARRRVAHPVVVELGALDASARAPVPRRRRAPSRVGAVRARSRASCRSGARPARRARCRRRGAVDRRVPPHARARARRGARSRRPPRRRAARRARWATRSASSSTACGCAGWPRACSRACRTTTRCSATATAPRSRVSCGCAPSASTTTNARCSRRSRRPPARASARGRVATCAAAPSTCHRVTCTTRSRRSTRRGPRRSPRMRRASRSLRSRRPSTSSACAPRSPRRAVAGRSRRVARAAMLLERARARRSPASTATSQQFAAELAAVSPLDNDRPISPTRLERWAVARTRTSWKRSCTSSRSSDPRRSCSSRRSIAARSCTRCSTASWATAARASASGCARSAEKTCADAEARGVTGRRLLWERDRRSILADLDAFVEADEHFRAERGTETLATELSFGMPDGRRRRSRSRGPTVGRCDCGARPTASTARRGGALVVIDYKTGSADRTTRSAPTIPSRAGTRLQLPVYVHAARACARRRRHRASRRTTGSSAGGTIAASATTSTTRSTRSSWQTVRTIVEGIEAGVFVAIHRRPGRAVRPVPVLRPRRFGHGRALAGVGAQVRRARARRLPRPAETTVQRPKGSGAWSRPVCTTRTTIEAAIDDRPARALLRSRRRAARDAIRTRLDATLFVEAGAGTGKTAALVDRVVALVASDVPMRAIAAITFTEKAAAELRDRIRRELASRRQHDRARRARRGRDLHAARVRAAHPHRVPDRGGAAAAHRGTRRDLVACRVRSPLAGVRRRAARRPRARSRRCW